MVVAVHFVASPTVFAVLVARLPKEMYFLPPFNRGISTIAVSTIAVKHTCNKHITIYPSLANIFYSHVYGDLVFHKSFAQIDEAFSTACL